MMEELRRGLLRNAREVIDDVILNGDTTAFNNINAEWRDHQGVGRR